MGRWLDFGQASAEQGPHGLTLLIPSLFFLFFFLSLGLELGLQALHMLEV